MEKKLSVVIPVFNSEKILKDCLETVKWADEIICVDMGSTDKTLEICRTYDVKIIKNTPLDRNFDVNRKIGIEKSTGDWVLKLDSDERVTKKLQDSIKKMLKNSKDICGYNILNRVLFFNKEVKHGFKGNKSYELRLFKRNKWSYNPFKFHQLIKVHGKTKFLKGEYLHFNSQSINSFIKRTNFYTDLDSSKDVNFRKDINFLHAVISPLYIFIKLYFLKLGFLDGTHGLIVKMLYAIYNFIYKIKIWEKRK